MMYCTFDTMMAFEFPEMADSPDAFSIKLIWEQHMEYMPEKLTYEHYKAVIHRVVEEYRYACSCGFRRVPR